MHLRLILTALLVTLISSASAQLATKGRLLLEENFSTPAAYTKEFQPAQPGWHARAWHQDWQRTPEGIASRWTTGHMPVLAFEGAFQDFVVELEFRFQKIPGQKALCRISALNPALDPRAYAVSTWANADSRERPWGVGLERDVWSPGTFTTLANEMVPFASDTWYIFRLEVVGDQALVTCNGVTLSARHEKFALPKTVLAIGTGNCPHEIRGLRVYEATRNPAWTPPAARNAPYVPIEKIPAREPLSPAVAEKIRAMPLLFDGHTLDGWVQAPVAPVTMGREDVLDVTALAKRLHEKSDPVSAFLHARLDEPSRTALAAVLAGETEPRTTVSPLVRALNRALAPDSPFYEPARFAGYVLPPETQSLLAAPPGAVARGRLHRLLLEVAYPRIIARSPASSWIVREGVMASTGAGRGVIYTQRDFAHYRLVFQVRQTSGNHQAGVLFFGQRQPAGELGLDALGALQFQVPSGGHWDYRPGINKSGTHFSRPVKIRFNDREWAQVEILVDARKGTAQLAVAQPVGTRAIATTSFRDPAAGRPGPIAWQMHNGLLFDEYRDVRLEPDPKEDKLITTN